MEELKTSKAEQNKALLERYPILKPYYTTRSDTDPYDYELTDLDCVYEGWKGIFLEACDEIMAHLKEIGEDPKEFHFFDIKEKYGSLRVNTAGYSDNVINDILWNLEQRSMLYCPNCGAPSKCVTQGYVLYLCPECAKKSELKFDWLTKDDVPVISEYNLKTGLTAKKPSKYDEQFRLQWDAIPSSD
jgi:hypothetical protein